MVTAVIALSVALVVVSIALMASFRLLREAALRADLQPVSGGLTPGPADRAAPQAHRSQLEVTKRGESHELRLNGSFLMSLIAMEDAKKPTRQRIEGSYGLFLGSLLDTPSVVDFVAGQRLVLARVPDAIRQGGKWLQAADGTMKTIATQAGSTRFAAVANVVKGGTATGSAVALGPAVIGAATVAYALHKIEATLKEIHGKLDTIAYRMRDSEIGVILGARRLVLEAAERGPPHLWPDQLRFELAVRRTALDPVCFAQRRELERLVHEMTNKNGTFLGLDETRRAQFANEARVLASATLVRAQLDYATTTILLDCETAPFGLDRVAAAEASFRSELSWMRTNLQAAIDGKQPSLVRLPTRRRSNKSRPLVQDALSEIIELAGELEENGAVELVLSVDENRSLIIEIASDSGSQDDDPSVESLG